MAKNKFKMTAFARFFIFLFFLTPLAYIGASYYNGQDGIQNIKNMLGIGQSTEQTIDDGSAGKSNDVSDEFVNSKIDRLENTIKKLEEENNGLHLENKSLKEELNASQQETQVVKDQLKAIKDAVGG